MTHCHAGDDNQKMGIQPDLELGKHVQHARDIFLCHNGANKPWVESLAEQLETVRYKDRYLGVVFDKWDFEKGAALLDFLISVNANKASLCCLPGPGVGFARDNARPVESARRANLERDRSASHHRADSA